MASKEELPDEELGLSEQIHVLAGLETGRVGCNRSNEDNPMVALDLPHLCSFVLSVAGIIYHLSTALSCSPALFCRRSVGVEEMHRYATKAFGVFEEWPNRFFPFLEWVRSKSNTYGAVSLLEKLGPLYVLLYEGNRDPRLDIVLRALEAYISANWRTPGETAQEGFQIEPRLVSRRAEIPDDRCSLGGMVGRNYVRPL
jgi:hypothetical protein